MRAQVCRKKVDKFPANRQTKDSETMSRFAVFSVSLIARVGAFCERPRVHNAGGRTARVREDGTNTVGTGLLTRPFCDRSHKRVARPREAMERLPYASAPIWCCTQKRVIIAILYRAYRNHLQLAL